jgi:hypothetical protein
MIAFAAAALLAAGAGRAVAAGQPWVWSLYENRASVTLAHEVPDTNALGAVLECAPGSGRVKVTVYPDGATRPQDKLTAQLAVSDPAFKSFLTTGRLNVKHDEASASIVLPAADKPKLDRFSKLCGA